MRSGGCSAGSSCVQRLDPFALPVRFAASDAAADERVQGCRAAPGARGRAALGRRHAHGAQSAADLLFRRGFAGEDERRLAPIAPWCSPTKIPGWSCRCSSHAKPTTPWPNGAAGPARSVCRSCCMTRMPAGATPSRAWEGCVSRSQSSAPAPPQRAAQAPSHDADAPAARQSRCLVAGQSRRARDHRAQLAVYLHRCSLSVLPPCRSSTMWSSSIFSSV